AAWSDAMAHKEAPIASATAPNVTAVETTSAPAASAGWGKSNSARIAVAHSGRHLLFLSDRLFVTAGTRRILKPPPDSAHSRRITHGIKMIRARPESA